ncbi:GNAT family N-acetyltransferase [Streptomyces sp. NPDC059578]|uniref:GNAT family N-acetyltransferase n=1 Tax=unclassified Streptomyces TaxID=2593676 RepID=UPI00365979CA
MRIRPARATDAAAVAQVHVRTWQTAYAGIVPQPFLDALDIQEATRTWTALLTGMARPRTDVLVTEDGPSILAFAGFGPAEHAPHRAEVNTLYAHPDVWGTGVGRDLLAATVTAMHRAAYTDATLWVLADNTRARRFYETAGWRFDGTTTQDHDGGAVLDKLRYGRPLAGTQE